MCVGVWVGVCMGFVIDLLSANYLYIRIFHLNSIVHDIYAASNESEVIPLV